MLDGRWLVTHDELLEVILLPTDETDLWYFRNALRAVVKLHKPSEPISDDGFITCETCNYEYFREYPYPCETIQAVERELR